MNPWLQVGLVMLAVLGVALQIAALCWRLVEES